VSADIQKQSAGLAAIDHIRNGMKVGLGTGSTAAWFVKALSDEIKGGLKVTLVSTSHQTTQLAYSLGLEILDIDAVGHLDICVDGADEIGPGLGLIKGGGGALLREKLIWEMADTCLVIADAAKHVETLGAFALPIEVEPFAHKGTINRICDVLSEFDIPKVPTLRKKSGEAFVTDGGNLIFDVHCGVIGDPVGLAKALKLTTGVVEHGLFLDLADMALIGTNIGVKAIYP
jgi:ribose 5-phosphate isomerase A